MTRTYRLLPLTIVLTAFAIGAVALHSVNTQAAMALVAAFIVAHGLVHLLFLVPTPQSGSALRWPFNLDRSWLVARLGLRVAQVRAFGVALAVVTALGFAIAALATLGIVLPVEAASRAINGSVIASALLLVVFFDAELLLGLVVDTGLVALALLSGWVPAIV